MILPYPNDPCLSLSLSKPHNDLIVEVFLGGGLLGHFADYKNRIYFYYRCTDKEHKDMGLDSLEKFVRLNWHRWETLV